MKPKVLVVGSSLKDMGGIVSVIKNIEDSSISEMYAMQRVETYITGSVFSRLLIFIRGFIQFWMKLYTFKPDIVHIHMANNGSFYRKSLFLLTARKLFRKSVILHIHAASFDDFYNQFALQRKYCHYILNQADKLIVLSQTWKEYFATIVPVTAIEVLYNGVFVKEPFVREQQTAVNALFMGRLGERKGVYDLLQSIQQLKALGVTATFNLAGDGEVEEVKAIVQQYGIEDRVNVLGWINGEQKEKLLREADLLVLPSYHEGLPMAILEAMNCGLPIISTTVGGIPEVITSGHNGLLIEPGDVHGLTSALEYLITDEEIRARMGSYNRAIISDKFDMNLLVGRLSGIYDALQVKVS
ncbi:glycosyltransferase family 4 protein [Paenibacillus sp. 37]|uniref:glycosyltransferase family 4 protein n=1 Tax=Paenibacillus sp. 37 TaxID=2607911 RepID=UPI00122EA0F8|nr:glycosyltransferase family 4 protein [Paenibacillus sp. 37]